MSTSDRRPSRGSVLYAVIVLLFLALIALLTVHRIMLQQNAASHRYLYGEVAYFLAKGAAEEVTSMLVDEAPSIREFLGSLRSLEAPADRIVLDVTPAVASELAASMEDSSVEVELVARDIVPLLRTRDECGVCSDPLEKKMVIELHARAWHKGVTRAVTYVFDVREINPAPVPFSRFVLHVDERGASDCNLLRFVPPSIFYCEESRSACLPLVIQPAPKNGPGVVHLYDPAGGRWSSAADLVSTMAEEPWRNNGWIFLGGNDPWYLNLAADGGIWGEQFHLRRCVYVTESAVFPGFQEKYYFYGFFVGMFTLPMFNGLEVKCPASGEVLHDAVSFLRLYGLPNALAPTIVIGNVYRRYGRFVKLRRGGEGCFVSFVYADEDSYPASAPIFEGMTGGGWEEYRRVMNRIVVEPYNRSYDYIVSSDESTASTVTTDVRFEAGDTPLLPSPRLRASAVSALLQPLNPRNELFLYPSPYAVQTDATACVRILDRGGAPLFEGNLAEVLPSWNDWILSRVTMTLSDDADVASDELDFHFFRQVDGGRVMYLGQVLRIPVASAFDLGPFVYRRGGIIVVDGGVRITGPIVRDGPSSLTVVSLSGDIVIGGDGRVDAMLIAPHGSIRRQGETSLDVRGAIAVGTLDGLMDSPKGVPGRIVYDPRLDPTRPRDERCGGYVFCIQRNPMRYLSRSE